MRRFDGTLNGPLLEEIFKKCVAAVGSYLKDEKLLKMYATWSDNKVLELFII